MLQACVPLGALETGDVLRRGQSATTVGVGVAYSTGRRLVPVARGTDEFDTGTWLDRWQLVWFIRPQFGLGNDREADITFTGETALLTLGLGVMGGIKQQLWRSDAASSAIGLRSGLLVDVVAAGTEGGILLTSVSQLRVIGATHFGEETAAYVVPSMVYQHSVLHHRGRHHGGAYSLGTSVGTRVGGQLKSGTEWRGFAEAQGLYTPPQGRSLNAAFRLAPYLGLQWFRPENSGGTSPPTRVGGRP